jgi:hypothetical protein
MPSGVNSSRCAKVPASWPAERPMASASSDTGLWAYSKWVPGLWSVPSVSASRTRSKPVNTL